MKKFAFIGSNGQINALIQSGIPDQYESGKTYGSNLAIELADDVHAETFVETHWYDRSEEDEAQRWKERDPCPGEAFVFSNGVWVWDEILFKSRVRDERYMRLSPTDWTVLPDSPLSDSKKAEWATYRQTLRDIPANIDAEARTLAAVSWPTIPS